MDSHAAQLATLSIAVGSKLENTLGDMSKRQTNHTEKINAQAATLHSLQNAHSSAERELKGAKGEISSLREELKKARCTVLCCALVASRGAPPSFLLRPLLSAPACRRRLRVSLFRLLLRFPPPRARSPPHPPQSKAETAQLQKDILALRGLVVQELKLDAKAGRS